MEGGLQPAMTPDTNRTEFYVNFAMPYSAVVSGLAEHKQTDDERGQKSRTIHSQPMSYSVG